LELVHQLRTRRQAQLRLAGEFGQSDAVDADIAPNLQMRKADINKSPIGLPRGKELRPEVGEESDQDLSDCEAVTWESA
jgi:hypothetical protein